MTRLTNAIREHIIDNAMSSKFDALEAAHVTRRGFFAEALYDHELIAQAEIVVKAGSQWYETTNEIYIHHPDFEYVRRHHRSADDKPKVYGDGDDKEDNRFPLVREVVTPNDFRGISVDEAHPFYVRAREVAKAGQHLRSQRDQALLQLRSMLNTFNTAKTLFDAWPEGEQFLGNAPKPPQKAMVPAELAARLNAMLGLEKAK